MSPEAGLSAQFGGAVVVDMLRTPPMVIIGGLLQKNPFFVPPDMPGMSGPDLQGELTRRRHAIPIVFITALGDETICPRLLAEGAVECLFKPFSESALLEALQAALRGH